MAAPTALRRAAGCAAAGRLRGWAWTSTPRRGCHDDAFMIPAAPGTVPTTREDAIANAEADPDGLFAVAAAQANRRRRRKHESRGPDGSERHAHADRRRRVPREGDPRGLSRHGPPLDAVADDTRGSTADDALHTGGGEVGDVVIASARNGGGRDNAEALEKIKPHVDGLLAEGMRHAIGTAQHSATISHARALYEKLDNLIIHGFAVDARVYHRALKALLAGEHYAIATDVVARMRAAGCAPLPETAALLLAAAARRGDEDMFARLYDPAVTHATKTQDTRALAYLCTTKIRLHARLGQEAAAFTALDAALSRGCALDIAMCNALITACGSLVSAQRVIGLMERRGLAMTPGTVGALLKLHGNDAAGAEQLLGAVEGMWEDVGASSTPSVRGPEPGRAPRHPRGEEKKSGSGSRSSSPHIPGTRADLERLYCAVLGVYRHGRDVKGMLGVLERVVHKGLPLTPQLLGSLLRGIEEVSSAAHAGAPERAKYRRLAHAIFDLALRHNIASSRLAKSVFHIYHLADDAPAARALWHTLLERKIFPSPWAIDAYLQFGPAAARDVDAMRAHKRGAQDTRMRMRQLKEHASPVYNK